MPPQFKISFESSQSGKGSIMISGPLNENAEIQSFATPTSVINGTLHINLYGLSSITSLGTRYFSQWSRGLKVNAILFEQCPRVFIDQLNMMPSFVPAHSSVSSFYVPYRTVGQSEELAHEVSILYSYPSNFRSGSNGKAIVIHPESVKDIDGRPMEMDVLAGSYFRFLDFYCAKSK